ncbi:TolC family protein [[Phormidium] sp. ETS-05]|uniref:TolC family protein n=1 Tax=[Phormidium] sp. ETS-05 TaxID=222819 RepID=UPI0018EF1274|nr:TolC family protein [[Phormidium] sp. ETS-05]
MSDNPNQNRTIHLWTIGATAIFSAITSTLITIAVTRIEPGVNQGLASDDKAMPRIETGLLNQDVSTDNKAVARNPVSVPNQGSSLDNKAVARNPVSVPNQRSSSGDKATPRRETGFLNQGSSLDNKAVARNPVSVPNQDNKAAPRNPVSVPNQDNKATPRNPVAVPTQPTPTTHQINAYRPQMAAAAKIQPQLAATEPTPAMTAPLPLATPARAAATKAEKSTPETKPQQLELTLSDAVILALENNRNLKNAYLDRIIQRQDLVVAEDRFNPNLTPEISVSYNDIRAGDNRNETGQISIGSTVTVKIPTGADFSANWSARGSSSSSNDIDSLSQNLEITFNQPLLRGFGAEVNRAPIQLARISEQINILNLKTTLIDTITNAIQAYRRLVQSQEALKIQQLSLQSQQRQLEITQALIEAGRRARVELVQSETAVANRQISVLASENNLKQARSDLLQILDIDRTLEIVATEIPTEVKPQNLDTNQLRELAFGNNADYLQQLLQMETLKLNALLAADEKQWDLSLNASFNNASGNNQDESNDLRAALRLTRELGNRQLDANVRSTEIRLQQAENQLAERRESLEIELANAIRDVNFNLKQVEQAQRARELSQQQLDNEREKLRLGVQGVRLIDIFDFEEQLVQAKNSELNAIIDYLNSITSLEQITGMTLQTWQVKIDSNGGESQ